MHQLMRRVALGLTLPLLVGAPVVLLPAPAHATGPELMISTSSEAGVYGQQITATAEVSDSMDPLTTGSVQFYIGPLGSELTPFGPRVPVDSHGAATSQILAQEDGRPLDITPLSVPWVIDALYYDGADQVTMAEDSIDLDITQSGSSIAVLPTATTLVADLTGELPGGAQANSFRPDGGAVQFKVDGLVAGTNDAVNGTATINYVLPPGSHTITASYSGDDRYLPASATAATRKDPILQARVLSTFPKTRAGWYGSPVEVWFTCKPQGSELVEDCPDVVTLKKSGKDQTVTSTIHAVDGGSATVTVTGIDIDRDKPVIKVHGNTCSATDKLSGLKGRCKMKIAANGHYRAIAVDKAGNRAVKRGVLN